MIEAVRWRPFARWFRRHATRRIRSSFAAVHVRGLNTLREAAADSPVVVIANHSSWWDSLLALWLSQSELPNSAAYGMMDASNLKRFRFFRWIGCFGVDLSSRRDGARAARYSLDLLKLRNTVLWIFPQGAEQPAHVPLRFMPGAAGIARRAESVPVIPVAFAYVFEREEQPHVYISVGEPMSVQGGANRESQEEAVEAERHRINLQVESRDQGFSTIFERKPTAVSRWATACLDRFAGWLAPQQARRRIALPSERPVDSAQAPSGSEP
ncbi:MAG: lysophospholipid acyltransferase family protein [Nannocystales bacterium]